MIGPIYLLDWVFAVWRKHEEFVGLIGLLRYIEKLVHHALVTWICSVFVGAPNYGRVVKGEMWVVILTALHLGHQRQL